MTIKQSIIRFTRKPIRIIGDFLSFTRELKIFDYFYSLIFMIIYQLPTSPTHFYSPLPDIRKLMKNKSRWLKEYEVFGIDWNIDNQKKVNSIIAEFKNEPEQQETYEKVLKKGFGEGFPIIESYYLYCFIRYLKPKKVIEVGSGMSTYYTLQACLKNKEETGNFTEIVCVEPYPRKPFFQFEKDGLIKFYHSEAQDVPLDLFKSLEEGDVLFIDSSHVLKIDSDVTYLYLQVIPNLKKGVIIHIHDICFPYLTLMPEDKRFRSSLLWNETSILSAILTGNDSFEILQCQSFLHHKYPEIIKQTFDFYDNKTHHPLSIWLKKVK